MVVRHVIVLFLLSFFQALASHLDHRIHMSEEREKEKEEYMQGKEKERDGGGKERGKGEEKKKQHIVSHGASLMPKVIVFVIVRESDLAAIIKKGVMITTYQAPSLCKIWHTNNERKRPKALQINGTIKNIGFQESGHRSLTQPTLSFCSFSSYRFFEIKQKMAHGGSWFRLNE